MKIKDFFGCTSTQALPVIPFKPQAINDPLEEKTTHLFSSSISSAASLSKQDPKPVVASFISKQDIDSGRVNASGFFYCQELGTTYRGRLVNSLLTGEGEIIHLDGTIARGYFKNSFLHGQGTIFFPNGGRIEGLFQEGILHGEGKITDRNGKLIEEGVFEEGVCVYHSKA